MSIDNNELLQALRNGVLRNALNGLPISSLTMFLELGSLVTGRNEVGLYDLAVNPDPVALRLGSTRGGLGKISGNVMVEWPDSNGAHVLYQAVDNMGSPQGPVKHFREEEVVLIQVKQDERWTDLDPRVDARALTGVITVHLRFGALAGDGMVKVLELAHDYLWTPWFQAGNVPTGDGEAPGPVSPSIGTGPVGAEPRKFTSDNGRYAFNVQGDAVLPDFPHGRIVQYDKNGSENPADWTAVAYLKPTPLPLPAPVPAP